MLQHSCMNFSDSDKIYRKITQSQRLSSRYLVQCAMAIFLSGHLNPITKQYQVNLGRVLLTEQSGRVVEPDGFGRAKLPTSELDLTGTIRVLNSSISTNLYASINTVALSLSSQKTKNQEVGIHCRFQTGLHCRICNRQWACGSDAQEVSLPISHPALISEIKKSKSHPAQLSPAAAVASPALPWPVTRAPCRRR